MDSRESTERTLLAGTFLFRGAPREAVELARTDPRALRRRAVRHLQHVRHMACGGSVQDCDLHSVLHDLQYFRYKLAGIQRRRLPRFQINFHPVGIFHMADTALQQVPVIIRSCNMMPSSEVQPFHPI